jgi:hypothetical protein
MAFPIPPSPFASICGNMAYLPKTAMNFAGDLQHDLRDHQAQRRDQTIAIWASDIAQAYAEAAAVLGISDDPIAICLEQDDKIDARTLSIAHDHMAAHWRQTALAAALTHPQTEGHDRRYDLACYGALLQEFRLWLTTTSRSGAPHRSRYIRLFCLVLVQQNTRQGILAEIDLYRFLAQIFPIRNLAPPPSPAAFPPPISR